jgi:hypothetical protein
VSLLSRTYGPIPWCSLACTSSVMFSCVSQLYGITFFNSLCTPSAGWLSLGFF